MRGAEAAGRRGKRLDGSLRFLASGEKPRLEGKSNLLRMRQEIPLSDAELAALDEGVSALESLLSRLANVVKPSCQRSDARWPDARSSSRGISCADRCGASGGVKLGSKKIGPRQQSRGPIHRTASRRETRPMVRARDPKHRSRKLLLPARVRRDRACSQHRRESTTK